MAPHERSRDPARGRRIQELRRALGYTSAAALAGRMGVHVRSVENWEGGKPVDGPNLGMLADLLDTTPDYIWTGKDPGGELGEDEIRQRLAVIDGRLTRANASYSDLTEFVRSNFERIGELERTVEDATTRVEGELAGLRELLEGLATAVKELRTSGVAPPQPAAGESPQQEKRATGGRRLTDPPLPPGR